MKKFKKLVQSGWISTFRCRLCNQWFYDNYYYLIGPRGGKHKICKHCAEKYKDLPFEKEIVKVKWGKINIGGK